MWTGWWNGNPQKQFTRSYYSCWHRVVLIGHFLWWIQPQLCLLLPDFVIWFSNFHQICVCVCVYVCVWQAGSRSVGKYIMHPSVLSTSHCDRIQTLNVWLFYKCCVALPRAVWLLKWLLLYTTGCIRCKSSASVHFLFVLNGILSETSRSLLNFIPDINEMGSVFQQNCDKVVKTPPNSSFLWLSNSCTCQELDGMCIRTVYEIMKKSNSLVPFLIHVC